MVAACDSGPAEEAKPSAEEPKPTLSDVPPPLVPAVPLPDNAVENAVAKLDGIADDLMKKSGIPGMAVAVVHGGKTIYAKGFGVRDIKTGRQGRPRHGVPARVVVQVDLLDRGGSPGGHERDRLGHADRVEAAVVRAVRSGRHQDGQRRRHVLAPVRVARPCGRHARGPRLRPPLRTRPAPRPAARPVPNLIRLHQLRADRRGRSGGRRARASPGRTSPTSVLFKPLGMSTASYRFSDFEARTNRALGHIHIDGRYEPLYVRDPQPEAPAGGASSSVNDMTHWLAMMLGQRQLRRKADRRPQGPAARADSADRVQPGQRARDARRASTDSASMSASTSAARMELSHSGRVRAGRGNQLRHPAVGRRGDRRADQRHAVRCARGAQRPVRRPGPVR